MTWSICVPDMDRHSVIYGLDAPAVTKPKHWREHTTRGLTSSFLHPTLYSWWKAHGSLYHKGCHAPSIRQSPSLVKQRQQISITNSILISSTVEQCTPISSTISSTEEHLFNGAKLIPHTISESVRYVIDKNDCLVQYYHTLSFTHQHGRYSDQPGRHFNSVEDSSQMAQQCHLLVGSRQAIQRCHWHLHHHTLAGCIVDVR